MDKHMEGGEERMAQAAEWLPFQRYQIFGQPSEGTRSFMEQAATAPGMTLEQQPEFLSGYLRLSTG